MTTHPERYYAPRTAARGDDENDISLEYDEGTWLERWGQVIAYGIALVALGWISGLMVVAWFLGTLQ